jgi:hypothetical protein
MKRLEDQDWLELWRTLGGPEAASDFHDTVRWFNDLLACEGRWHSNMAFPAFEMEQGFGGPLVVGRLGTTTAEESADRKLQEGRLELSAEWLTLLIALSRLGTDVPYRLVLLADEECTDAETQRLVVSRAKEAPLAIVVESASEADTMVVERAGSGRYELTIDAGRAPTPACDGGGPLEELSRQILWLTQLRSRALDTMVEVLAVAGEDRRFRPAVAHAEVAVRVWTEAEMQRIRDALSVPPIYDRDLTVTYAAQAFGPPMRLGPEATRWWRQASGLWKEIAGVELTGVRAKDSSSANYIASWTPTLSGLGPWNGDEPGSQTGDSVANGGKEEAWWPSIKCRAELIRRLLTLQAAS